MVIGSANGSYQIETDDRYGRRNCFYDHGVFDGLFVDQQFFTGSTILGGLVLLIAVRFFGTEVNGAKRWIDFGGFSFQPSDIMKIVVIIFFTRFFHEA